MWWIMDYFEDENLNQRNWKKDNIYSVKTFLMFVWLVKVIKSMLIKWSFLPSECSMLCDLHISLDDCPNSYIAIAENLRVKGLQEIKNRT